MIVKMIKMDFLHKSSVGSELSICINISSSAIVRIREHVKQVWFNVLPNSNRQAESIHMFFFP